MVKTGLRISQPLGGTTSPFLLLQQGIFVRRPRCPCLSQTFVCSCQYRATTQKKYSARHKRDLRGARQHQESASPKRSPIKKKNDHPLVRGRARLMQLPGFEPGLSRPQREVLTTIRQLPIISATFCLHNVRGGNKPGKPQRTNRPSRLFRSRSFCPPALPTDGFDR